MKNLFILINVFFMISSFAEEQITIDQFKSMILDHAESLNEYPEGSVFLQKKSRHSIFVRQDMENGTYGFYCEGPAEIKSTIIASGIEDVGHLGEHKDERYYVLEEMTFHFDKESTYFRECQDKFRGEVIQWKKIFLRQKNRIKLADFKNLFRWRYHEIYKLDAHRVKVNRSPDMIEDYGHGCSQFPDKRKSEKELKIPKVEGSLEVILDLSRPWEFAEEKYTYLSDYLSTRESLPALNWEDLFKFLKKIENVDVFVGPMNYMRGGGPCNVEIEVPELKWKDLEPIPYPMGHLKAVSYKINKN